MPIRQLTADEKDRLLTQEEVNDLPDGADVLIKWSGGNGPHRYELSTLDGVDHPYVDGTPLKRVSADPDSGLTKVFLPEC